ncbi:hypothetical protein CRENBAI_017622 [Crenichthys baileyi]|uniref:Uncharacterized protein n=1 Tax=Crenichthys baileyi TaxID=28760 RepID=A0AAV9RY72_9TELE
MRIIEKQTKKMKIQRQKPVPGPFPPPGPVADFPFKPSLNQKPPRFPPPRPLIPPPFEQDQTPAPGTPGKPSAATAGPDTAPDLGQPAAKTPPFPPGVPVGGGKKSLQKEQTPLPSSPPLF